MPSDTEFEQKALRLASKLDNLSFHQHNNTLHQNNNNFNHNDHHQYENGENNTASQAHSHGHIIKNQKAFNSHSTSPTLLELEAFRREIEQTQEEKLHKSENLQGEIVRLKNYLVEENEARSIISENFLSSARNVEKNMRAAIGLISKNFEEKEKKLNAKISEIISHETKQLQSDLSENEALFKHIEALSEQVNSLEQELEHMKKSRYILEDKIYKQFVDQLKELRIVHDRDIREREEREASIMDCMKGVYTSLMGELKKEEHERELNEKGFLSVIEQLIDRIVEQ